MKLLKSHFPGNAIIIMQSRVQTFKLECDDGQVNCFFTICRIHERKVMFNCYFRKKKMEEYIEPVFILYFRKNYRIIIYMDFTGCTSCCCNARDKHSPAKN